MCVPVGNRNHGNGYGTDAAGRAENFIRGFTIYTVQSRHRRRRTRKSISPGDGIPSSPHLVYAAAYLPCTYMDIYIYVCKYFPQDGLKKLIRLN